MSNTFIQAESSATPRLYTPNMVLVSTMLSGPLAGGALIAMNYKALGNKPKVTKTILWSLATFILLIAVGFIIRHIGGSAAGLSGGLAVAGRQLCKQLQWETECPKNSWWITLLISILAIIVTLGVAILLGFMIPLPRH